MTAAPNLTLHRSPSPQPGAPAVVLLHGLASDCAADFEATGLIAALQAAGRDVITVDLPGHGTAGARTDITVPGLLADVAAGVLSLVGDAPVDVVGYSLGGRLGWDLPAAGLNAHRLALGGVAPQEPFAFIDPAALRAVVLEGAEPADQLTGMIGGMLSHAAGDKATLVALVAALGATPFAPGAAPAQPTLVLAGDQDPVAGDPGWAADALPQGSVATVPGDHLAALRSPEFAAAVLAHLA